MRVDETIAKEMVVIDLPVADEGKAAILPSHGLSTTTHVDDG
jgi:hypothetical protein